MNHSFRHVAIHNNRGDLRKRKAIYARTEQASDGGSADAQELVWVKAGQAVPAGVSVSWPAGLKPGPVRVPSSDEREADGKPAMSPMKELQATGCAATQIAKGTPR